MDANKMKHMINIILPCATSVLETIHLKHVAFTLSACVRLFLLYVCWFQKYVCRSGVIFLKV